MAHTIWHWGADSVYTTACKLRLTLWNRSWLLLQGDPSFIRRALSSSFLVNTLTTANSTRATTTNTKQEDIHTSIALMYETLGSWEFTPDACVLNYVSLGNWFPSWRAQQNVTPRKQCCPRRRESNARESNYACLPRADGSIGFKGWHFALPPSMKGTVFYILVYCLFLIGIVVMSIKEIKNTIQGVTKHVRAGEINPSWPRVVRRSIDWRHY
jgi:hypothetical protein